MMELCGIIHKRLCQFLLPIFGTLSLGCFGFMIAFFLAYEGSVRQIKAWEVKVLELASENHRLKSRLSILERVVKDELLQRQLDQVIKPTFRILPSGGGRKEQLLRVELSPLIAEGLVQEVSVSWGDEGDAREVVYSAEGDEKNFQAIHAYQLPPSGRTLSSTAQLFFVLPEDMMGILLSEDDLSPKVQIEATSEGIYLRRTNGMPPSPMPPPEISWLSPQGGSETGWKPEVVLKSQTATERVTLLVRPHTGSTFYVQPEARPLLPGEQASFQVQLAGGRSGQIGTEFDVYAICSDSFAPSQWSIEMQEVPYLAIAGHITVRKAAGVLRLEDNSGGAETVRAWGEIWTPDGGALAVGDGVKLTIVQTLAPSPVGSEFELSIPRSEMARGDLFLVVWKHEAPQRRAGERISPTTDGDCWLYAPSRTEE
jgi:hypothetical protein